MHDDDLIYPELDSSSAIRSGNGTLRRLAVRVTAATRAGDFEKAVRLYEDITACASSLRESCERRRDGAA